MRADFWLLAVLLSSFLLMAACNAALWQDTVTAEMVKAQGGSFSLLTLAVLAGLRRWRANRCSGGKTSVDKEPAKPVDVAAAK